MRRRHIFNIMIQLIRTQIFSSGDMNVYWTRTTLTFFSLARHTLQSAGKEGLVTSRTTSCSGDRIWLRPIRFETLNLLLSNALLAARAHIAGPGPRGLRLPVTFFVIIAFRQNNSLYAISPDPLSPRIEGCGERD